MCGYFSSWCSLTFLRKWIKSIKFASYFHTIFWRINRWTSVFSVWHFFRSDSLLVCCTFCHYAVIAIAVVLLSFQFVRLCFHCHCFYSPVYVVFLTLSFGAVLVSFVYCMWRKCKKKTHQQITCMLAWHECEVIKYTQIIWNCCWQCNHLKPVHVCVCSYVVRRRRRRKSNKTARLVFVRIKCHSHGKIVINLCVHFFRNIRFLCEHKLFALTLATLTVCACFFFHFCLFIVVIAFHFKPLQVLF